MSAAECKICLRPYNEEDLTPRILTSCGHTICQQCATILSTDGRMIVCPFDRKITHFNRSGVPADDNSNYQGTINIVNLEGKSIACSIGFRPESILAKWSRRTRACTRQVASAHKPQPKQRQDGWSSKHLKTSGDSRRDLSKGDSYRPSREWILQ
ncbi:unnamed protein product [Caenorhabditis brenneri]